MKPPILRHKETEAPSVFRPENLLREARRQKTVATGNVPAFCLLDPDGDILRHLRHSGEASLCETWACYHSDMFAFERANQRIGIVGCAVGAPYAVLLAEQMFASGCRLLISITSSGQLKPLAETPYFVLVERAWRDEGTSYHYLPPSDFAAANPMLIDAAEQALQEAHIPVHRGATWTTDAPFRETDAVIQQGHRLGLAAIEMETAALYAFAAAKNAPVLCFAQVTNTMAVRKGDFEKGAKQGALDALRLVEVLVGSGLHKLHRPNFLQDG